MPWPCNKLSRSLLVAVIAVGLAACGVEPLDDMSTREQTIAQQLPASVTAAPTSTSSATATILVPSVTPEPPTSTPIPPTPDPPTPIPPTPTPIVRQGRVYRAYVEAALKNGQEYQYSCEFDAAWVILATYGIRASVGDIIAQTPINERIEPWYEEKDGMWLIHGGDITQAYSGDYTKNFLARSTGSALIPVFARFGLRATPVSSREAVQAALDRGELIWIKTTVDFKKWRPALWIMPDGSTRQTVLGNDHAVVVMGYNEQGVVIRDVLGPTSTNRQRPLEYDVAWPVFLGAWGAQNFDGLTVARPGS